MIPGSGRSPGGLHDSPVHYSYLGNPMDKGAWQATLHVWVCKRIRHDLVTKRQQKAPRHVSFLYLLKTMSSYVSNVSNVSNMDSLPQDLFLVCALTYFNLPFLTVSNLDSYQP